jgi:MOSC domain-containing protein YiiM
VSERGPDSGWVASLNVSNGGVPKRPISEVRITRNGIEGDRQRDLRYHGGPERAVSMFSLERIQALQTEGHPIDAGTTGENITVGGLDWDRVLPGSRLRIGEVELEITAFAAPCKTIRRSFVGEAFVRMSQRVHPGFSRVYARVSREGSVRVGDAVVML